MALTTLLISKAGSFLLAKWKWIVISIVLLIVLYLGFKVYEAFKDREALEKQLEGTITQLVQDNTKAEIQRQFLEATIEKMLVERQRNLELYQATIKLYEDIHKEVAEQKQIFEDHDFTALSNAKPGLIIKPMNDATKERFDEISNIFND